MTQQENKTTAEAGRAEADEREAMETAGEADDQAGEAVSVETDLEKQLAEARAQADDFQQRFLRAQADFDNFRRRSRQEREDLLKYASSKLIEQLLPVVDNFDRALSSSREAKDFDALAKGLDMTFRQLESILSAEGLTVMETVGQPFNPEHHQAIMQVESEEYGEGVVVEEVQKGYMLKDKVLRPAMVKVSV